MSDRDDDMNLKLNNDIKSSMEMEKSPESLVKDKETKRLQQERCAPCVRTRGGCAGVCCFPTKLLVLLYKEERRRTGRYIAILVGICLFILAIYHAWVRKIPVVASLVVPALIMFVYVAWVLYTASRDKNKCLLFDLEAGSGASPEPEGDVIQIAEVTQNNAETTIVTTEGESNLNTPVEHNWSEISSALYKDRNKNVRPENKFILPIILVNDKPPDDLDQKWLNIIDLSNNEKLKCLYKRRRFKRRFCRSRKYAAFKRSYSIA